MNSEGIANSEKVKACLDQIKKVIERGDGKALGSHLSQLRAIGGGQEALASALADCALDVMPYTGYDVIIYSTRLGREVVLGKDISWSALKDLIRVRPKTESLSTMVAAALELQGRVEQVMLFT